GRAVVVRKEAAKVLDMFKRSASGEPDSQIARRYGLAHTTVRQILMNPAYIGVARSGEYSKENAHPAIVSRELWDAVQGRRRRTGPPPGETTQDRLLLGMARCAGCGKTLKVVRRKQANGTFVVSYYCKDAASERCQDRAYVHADDLDIL